MVEVFKTNITENGEANILMAIIDQHYPDYQVNFDLEDCDRILRIAGEKIRIHEIIHLADSHGYEVTELTE